MRPKKTILCVGDDEQLLAERAFLLETRNYRVVKAENTATAERWLNMTNVAVVVLQAPLANALSLLRSIRLGHPETRSLVTSEDEGYSLDLVATFSDADLYIPKGHWPTSELLERLRILTARKRGPKQIRSNP